MAISEGEWASIRNLVVSLTNKVAGPQRGYFVTGKVIKRDPDNRLVWLKEFGDQAIPVVGFDYNVKYYDTDNTGTVNVKKVIAEAKTPDIGESVLVAREMGEQSLPRCLGVFQGTNWIITETSTAESTT